MFDPAVIRTCALVAALAVGGANAGSDWRDLRPEPRVPRPGVSGLPDECMPDPTLPPTQEPTPPRLRYQPLAGVTPVPAVPRQLDQAAARAWLDSVVGRAAVVGAAAVIVKDGAILHDAYWGFADAAYSKDVDARTRFRVGSISKVFTWTALMQLYERGLLELDDDAAADLRTFPLSMPRAFSFRNLLTHTAGFEDKKWGYLIADNAADLEGLSATLAEHVPRQQNAPTADFADARNASYSNWGAALAGQIVTDLTGVPFDAYMRDNILEPLLMKDSTFEEPVRRGAEWSEGFEQEGSRWPARPFEYFHDMGPASSLSVTAPDMAQFMIAHLGLGHHREGAPPLLAEATARIMQSRVLSPHPQLNGYAHGFAERYINGRRTLGHAGKTLYFTAEMMLVPGAGVGIFVAMNTIPGRGPHPSSITEAFIDAFFPSCGLPPVQPPPDFARRGADYEGWYAPTHRSYSTSEALFSALSGAERVQATDDGTLSYKTVEWVEVAPDLFRLRYGEEMIAFAREGDRVTHLLGPVAVYPHYRVGTIDAATLEFALALAATFEALHAQALSPPLAAAVFVLLFAMMAVAVPPRVRAVAAARPARCWAWGLGVTNALILAVVMRALWDYMYAWRGLLVAIPWYLHALSLLSLASLLLTLAVLWQAALGWRNPQWTRYGRIEYTVTALAALAFACWLFHWNLLGFTHT